MTTVGYNPRCNGQTEKLNHTLSVELTTQCQDKRDKWDEYIPTFMFAYNSSVHESTGFTPFELALHRTPVPRFATLMGFEPTSSSPQTPLNVKLETARNNIIATQQKNKTIVNNKRKPCDLTIGDKVLYEYPPLAMEKGAKLNFRYTGPFLSSINSLKIIIEFTQMKAVIEILLLTQHK